MSRFLRADAGAPPPADAITPDWPAPARVGALVSTRAGGTSPAPWDHLNLGAAVGDDPARVVGNRHRFAAALSAPTGAAVRPVFLRQVHGTRVVRLDGHSPDAPAEAADAAWTDQPGLACTVQVADCLPVLFCVDDGRAVAAAHAGWRGLAAGVLEATVQALCAGVGVDPARVLAWLGPCIGPAHFEVGADVLQAFGRDPGAGAPPDFAPQGWRDGRPRWHADLPALAAQRLAAAGVRRVSRSGLCTVGDASRFFSFRRDGITGRQAAAVWIIG